MNDVPHVISARAKLNLGLRVFPARADGFHDVETWMAPISWHDTLRVEAADVGAGILLEVTGRAEGVPVELEKNLVGRAALKLAMAGFGDAGHAAARAKIVLHKVLPPGGGLGGGSSDAAAALVLLNKLWGLGWNQERLERLAAELGSDVPFFVRGMPSLCTGRGEVMTPLRPKQPLFAVLIVPPMGCPTKEVYQAFDRGQHDHKTGNGKPRAVLDWAVMARATAEELNDFLVNDLEPGAFAVVPALAELRQRAARAAGQKVHLTGSGSTLFTLCSSSVAAGAIGARIAGELGDTCASVTVRVG